MRIQADGELPRGDTTTVPTTRRPHGGAAGGVGSGVDVRPGPDAAPQPPAAPPTPAEDPAEAAPHGLDLPFVYDHGPVPTLTDDTAAVFRFPAADDPEPRSGRVLGLAGWAGVLGVLGLAAGARGALAMLGGPVPWWYQVAMLVTGMSGVCLTIGAFLSVHRRRLPWVLLAAATVALLGVVTLNARVL